MKVVLFAGGRGTRMRDGAADAPKPMSVLGGRPLLWHLMDWYASHGHTEFVLCLGHRGDDVERAMRAQADPHWDIAYVDTGLDAPVGQRLKAVRGLVEHDSMFLANYADVLSDVSLPDLVDTFTSSTATAALVVVRPQASFHLIEMQPDGLVQRVSPVTEAPIWQNGGFFVMRPDVFDVIQHGEDLVDAPFARLASGGRLLAYQWEGFWAPLDTQKDRQRIQGLYEQGHRPWSTRAPRAPGASRQAAA